MHFSIGRFSVLDNVLHFIYLLLYHNLCLYSRRLIQIWFVCYCAGLNQFKPVDNATSLQSSLLYDTSLELL